jgi:SulP family sulfate permease
MNWYFRPALITALRSGYKRSDLLADLSAGVLVGVVALPLAMAFGIASGCTAEQGLFTAIIAGALVSLLGGSRYQISGPTGAFVGLCASGVAAYGYQGLALATMAAGVMLVGMSLLRLGKYFARMPTPIVVGFTSGIAVVIASTQLKELFGLTYGDRPVDFIGRIRNMALYFPSFKTAAFLLAAGTMVIIVAARRISPQIPAALIALVALSIVTAAANLDVAVIGAIPDALPAPGLPDFGIGTDWTWNSLALRLYEVRWLAVAIALLGAIESLLSAVVADGMTGGRHHSDTELGAQGLANIVSPLFLGLPVTGAIARTATNIRAGARSPLSGVIHSVVLLLILLVGARVAGHIPLACLAGVLLVVCWNMAEVRRWPGIFRASRADAFILLLVFLLTVFVDLTVAVGAGVMLHLALRRLGLVAAPAVDAQHTAEKLSELAAAKAERSISCVSGSAVRDP